MRVINVPTSFNIDVEFELPGFRRRMASLFIDMAIQLCYLVFAGRVIRFIERSNSWDSEDASYNLWAVSLLLMVPVFVYHVVMEVATNGQSMGKKIMRLRVVNLNGGKASISQFIIRWLLRVSDLWIMILLFLLLVVV